MADYFSPKSANNYQVRRTLRIRSRYEVSNNPFLWGVCNNNADDLVGTGPTLKLSTSDAQYNLEVESAWREWADEVDLVEKLRTCKLARSVDGEGFLVLKTVEDLENEVKLYPCDLEADQVTTPAPANLADLWVDGLTLHPVTQRPTHYHVLRHHPGDLYFPDLNPLAVDKIPARYMIHWFPKFRPGQVRGVPIFTPSLDLFTELRAFRKATLGAAEIAADYAAVLESEAPASQDTSLVPVPDGAGMSPFVGVPIQRKMQVMLPSGMTLKQLAAAHPATTYEMFQEKCLGEAIRPLSYPLNLALGTSQKFNFSSSKLDIVNYRAMLTIERSQAEKYVLARLFKAWYQEAVLVGRIRAYDGLNLPPHDWHWSGWEPLDPAVEAKADADRLAGGMDTWQAFWARRGYDWKSVMAQQAAEKAEIDRLKLTFGDVVKRTVTEQEDAKPEAANAV
jgi:capsid protein